MNIARWGIVVVLAWPAGIAAGQQQSASQTSAQSDQKQSQKPQDPLAAAARRAREQKKQEPKAERVWTNDNIPTTPDSISVVGESNSTGETSEKTTSEKTANDSSSASAASGSKGTSSQDSTERGASEERKAALTKELAQAKERVQSLATDLDILSRKYTLDQQMYYGKPDYSSDTEGAVALKVEESQIASKKQEVADAQKKVDDLTAQLKELEGESAKPASNSQ